MKALKMIKEILGPQDWSHINLSLKNNEITIIDDFFTEEILSILKIRILSKTRISSH